MSANELIGTQEIAAMLGVCRAHAVSRIIKRPDFPPPAVDLSQRLRRWEKRDVLAWATRAKSSRQRRRPSPGSTPTAAGSDPCAR